MILFDKAFLLGVNLLEFLQCLLPLLHDIAFAVKKKKVTYRKRLAENKQLVFIQNHELEDCITRLNLLMLKYSITDEKGVPLAPKNETDMLVNYLAYPISAWPMMQHEKLNGLALEFENEPFINCYDQNQKYYITDLCRQYALESPSFNQDFMQKNVYSILRFLSEDQYRYCRRWIIENPIIDVVTKMNLEQKFIDQGIPLQIAQPLIKNCYEKITSQTVGRCLHCGWTVMANEHQKYCIDTTCRSNTDDFTKIEPLEDLEAYYRLNSGVMFYISFHGRFELDLNDYCINLGIESKLWPNHDTYDLHIIIGDKEYAIDVKNYSNPYSLRNSILNKGVFRQAPRKANCWIVVPDERFGKEGYAQIVEDASKGEFQVMKLSSFKRFLKKEAKLNEDGVTFK